MLIESLAHCVAPFKLSRSVVIDMLPNCSDSEGPQKDLT